MSPIPSDEDNFAEMLKAYTDGMKMAPRVGEKLRCKIISIGKDMLYVDTGTKVDGRRPTHQTPAPSLTIQPDNQHD